MIFLRVNISDVSKICETAHILRLFIRATTTDHLLSPHVGFLDEKACNFMRSRPHD